MRNFKLTYIAFYIVISFLLVYLHRRADLFSSAWLIIGVFAAYLPIIVLFIRDMVSHRKLIIGGLLGIYAVGLYSTSATFFILGKTTFDQSAQIFSFLALTFSGIAIYLQRKKDISKSKVSNFEVIRTTIPPIMGVITFVVLNFR